MSKVRYLLFVFVFLVFAGCVGGKDKDKENYIEKGIIVHPIKNHTFVVLGWEQIDKTDMIRVIVKDKDFNWQLNLIDSRRSAPEIGQEIEICFLGYFYDNSGKWNSIPIIKR